MKINVVVKPGKKHEKIEVLDGVYHIDLKEDAEKNKANIELINLLAKHFNTSSANIKILRGLKSRKKLIEWQ